MNLAFDRRLFLFSSAASLTSALLKPGQAHAGVPFSDWLVRVKDRARAAGVSGSTVDEALKQVEPDPKVVELDRRQPEGRLSFIEYRRRVLSDARISGGRRRFAKHQSLLTDVERRYGVPAEVLVSLWGIESSFGEYKGRFSVIRSLATLAHDGRRAEFFEGELIAALKIIDAGDIELSGMFGSWAGAMGQSQFMPSTYLNHAVDFDGDGRRNIWTSLDDTFGSMANYLRAVGWDPRYIWGRQVTLTQSVPSDMKGRDNKFPLERWQELGVRRANGTALPKVAITASLIETDDGAGPTYLTYGNFDALMRWNRSTYFALSVGQLADKIRQA